MKLKEKKLLIVGANGNMCHAVNKANKLGIYTVVVDYFEDSLAKKTANKSFLISTADTESLAKLCRTEKIDGVFTGYSELNLNFTRKLCDRTGFPFYATTSQIEMLTNKRKFKDCCRKYGVPCVSDYKVSISPAQEELDAIKYPVIVKPVDSFSGKGISICYSEDVLCEAIQKAIATSVSKQFLIESFMEEEKYDVFTVYYTIQKGTAVLSGIVDRYMYMFENNRRLSTALLYPSEYLKRYQIEVDAKVRNMLSMLGIKDGTIFIEGAVNRETFEFWECGFRLCGAQQGIITGEINGVDVEELLINYALTGEMSDRDVTKLEDPTLKGKVACNLLLFSNPCKIAGFEGIDEICAMPEVINYTSLYSVGNEIKETDIGTLNQSFSRLHIVCESRSRLAEIIKKIYSTIKIYNEKKENQLINTIDYDFIVSKSTRFAE